MNFQYEFDKSSKKYRCPKCGKKRMVCYYDKETKQQMPLNFGRCERATECCYISYPKTNKTYIKPTEHVYTPKKHTSYHNYNLVSQSARNYKNNNFIQSLKLFFNDEQIKEVITKYCIGTSKLWNNKGACVFWQLDDNEKVRHGKIMLYDAQTGKRKKDKNGKAYIHSVSSLLKLKNFNLEQCLFGLHLINETSSKTIALVESEKTAIIMSIYKPEYLWLATGSESGFKYEYLKAIKDYKIIAFPDNSEYYKWLNKSLDLNKLGFDISVSKYIENMDCKKGTDLADVFIKEFKSKELDTTKPIKSFGKSKKKEIIQSNTDIIASKLVKTNPNLIELINAFELTDSNGLSINIIQQEHTNKVR